MTYEMKYYREPDTGEVFAYEGDGSQDDYIRDELVAMSKAEVEEFFRPKAFTDGVTVVYSAAPILGWSLATAAQVALYEAKELLDAAVAEAARLRKIADDTITPLQDAVELDLATEAEVGLLKSWKRYRVALSRVPEQEGYPAEIDWPAPPA